MKKERMNEIKGKKRTQYDSGGGRGLSYYITWAAAFQMGAGLFSLSLSRPLQFFTFSLISFFIFSFLFPYCFVFIHIILVIQMPPFLYIISFFCRL
jgi:hypothetical protein